MYIQTREGLGQVRVSAHCAEPAPGEFFFIVEGFPRGSAKLRPHIEKDIRDIAECIAKILGRKLPPIQQGKYRDFDLFLTFEGHVDKKTDPRAFGRLDLERASIVQSALFNELERWTAKLRSANLINSFSTSNNFVAAGPHRPRPGIEKGGGNRRVEVRGRWKFIDRDAPF